LSSDSERGPAGPVSGARTALSRLITASPGDFADDYWGVKPLLSRAAELGQDFSDLFSLAAVDELVAQRAIRTPFVRMANEGELLPASRYTSGAGFGAEVSDQLDADKVLAEFASGATLVLQGLHRTWAPLREFTRRLVEELGHPAQVNAYVTPASSRGFDPHYDVHDVFVIQVHGQKHWVIHEPVFESPLADQPWSDRADAVAEAATKPPAIDATFAPGDVLYLPRGWIHSATALGGTSIHLTIGVPALTRWDIVEQLVSRLKDDPALRTALPVGITTDAAALEQAVADTIEALAVSITDPGDIGARLARKLSGSTRPEPVLPISTVERIASLGAQTVRWREGIDARIEHDAEKVRVILADRTITLPVEALSAIHGLRRAPAPANALAGLDPGSSLVVARRLLREGVLVFG